MAKDNKSKNNKNNNNLNNNNLNNNNLNNNNLNDNNNLNNNNLNNNNLNNNLNNNNSNKKIKEMDNNEELNKFINNRKEDLRKIKKIREQTINSLNSMPLQLKIFNVLIASCLTYFFTGFYYNLALSITFAVLTAILLYVYGTFYISIIFVVLYSVFLIQIINRKYKQSGVIIEQTDINKTTDKKAFICDKDQNSNNVIPYSKFREPGEIRDFSISLCLYVNGSNPKYKNNFGNYRFRDWKSIFYLGSSAIEKSETPLELKDLNQIPGLWLKPSLNNIVLVINDGINNNRLELDNIPLNEWFTISIVVNSASVLLYLNCKLEKILSLNSIIGISSEYNLYIANDANLIKYSDQKTRNGFAGQMAYFTYYNYILNQDDINNYCKTYKKKLDQYQNKENDDYKYETSCLVTDSDKNSL